MSGNYHAPESFQNHFRPIGAGVEPDSELKINPLPPAPTKASKKAAPKTNSSSAAVNSSKVVAPSASATNASKNHQTEETRSQGEQRPSEATNLTNDILPKANEFSATVAPNEIAKEASLLAKMNETKSKSVPKDKASTAGIPEVKTAPAKATSATTESSKMDSEEIVLHSKEPRTSTVPTNVSLPSL